MMNPIPLKKSLYNEAIKLGVEDIQLHFEGGNDEGNLTVNLRGENLEYGKKYDDLCEKVEAWAYDAYEYNGGGDGNPYGDSFYYDLKEGTMSSREWFTQTSENYSDNMKLEME